jgi:hypothetical protein
VAVVGNCYVAYADADGELYIYIRELPQLRVSVGHTYISSDAVAIVKMARPCYKSSARRDRHSGTGVLRSVVSNARQYIRGPWAATYDRGASDRQPPSRSAAAHLVAFAFDRMFQGHARHTPSKRSCTGSGKLN